MRICQRMKLIEHMIHEATIIGYPIQFFIKKQRFPKQIYSKILLKYTIYIIFMGLHYLTYQ